MRDKGGYYTRPCVRHNDDGTTENVDVQCIRLARLYDFQWGNVVKYLWRWRGKNGLEDLQKAWDYAKSADCDPTPTRGLMMVRDTIYGLIEVGDMPQVEIEAWLSILNQSRRGVVIALTSMVENQKQHEA